MFRVVSTVTPDTEAKIFVDRSKSPLDDDLLPEEIVIKVEAAPINPSDLGVMLPAGTDAKGLKSIKKIEKEVGLTYPIDKKFAKVLASRVGLNTPCGNEGAGVVVKAGEKVKHLMGKVVSGVGGSFYAQYRKLNLKQVIVHKDGTTPEDAASSYVNPVTVLAMIETFREEKHKAMIHTAAASNLGQMLQKMCNKENIPLINVVRKDSQEEILKSLGAKYIIRSDKETFLVDLANAVAETKCTLAFDAVGGGNMASNLLTAMEMGAKKFSKFDPSSPYGTPVHKQVYIYGGLDRTPTVLSRGFGFSWSISSWLMPRVLAKLPVAKVMKIHESVAENITGIFKSEYYKRISLEEMVELGNFGEYMLQQTGKKFLVLPNKNTDKLSNKL